MALVVITRNFVGPSTKKVRRTLLMRVLLPQVQGQDTQLRTIITRTHFIARTGTRKKTLYTGLLSVGKLNRNVLLYRKLQPSPQLTYPVFTPWRRRVKALGQSVAPVVAVGGGGSGINLTHALGLSLMSLGGMKF